MTHWRIRKAINMRLILANALISLFLKRYNPLVNESNHAVVYKNAPKIFCIGLSKSGTTSLSKALNILGYKCSHYPIMAVDYWVRSSSVAKILNFLGWACFGYPLGIGCYRMGEKKINLRDFQDFDAFADIPIAYCFKELDKMFPGSKFILTIREPESWLRSCQKHMYRPYRSHRPTWWDDKERAHSHFPGFKTPYHF